MRHIALVLLCAAPLRAQVTVAGEVILKESGQPLPFATVAVLSQGRQILTSESGRFQLTNLPAGQVRLRFKRIGFVPKDTTLTVTDSGRVRIEMTRLVIQLPPMVVSEGCTDRTPFEQPATFMADLIGQVAQNSERMKLLSIEKPFEVRYERTPGLPDSAGRNVARDTVQHGPMPAHPYAPGRVIFGEGIYKNRLIMLPELADIADTAFTNNHCFHFAGSTRLGADSVVRIDFEPVPRLARVADLAGSLYLRADGYQLVRLFTRLQPVPDALRRGGLEEYTVVAAFRDILPAIPVLESSELINRFRGSRPSFSQRVRLLEIVWR